MNNRDENRNEVFVERVGEALNAQAKALDGITRARLNRSRQAALAEMNKSGLVKGVRWNWMPAGGLVLASLLVAVVWLGNFRPVDSTTDGIFNDAVSLKSSRTPARNPAPAAGDLEMLLVDEDFEMLQDLDFYNWLQSVPGRSGEGSVG